MAELTRRAPRSAPRGRPDNMNMCPWFIRYMIAMLGGGLLALIVEHTPWSTLLTATITGLFAIVFALVCADDQQNQDPSLLHRAKKQPRAARRQGHKATSTTRPQNPHQVEHQQHGRAT